MVGVNVMNIGTPRALGTPLRQMPRRTCAPPSMPKLRPPLRRDLGTVIRLSRSERHRALARRIRSRYPQGKGRERDGRVRERVVQNALRYKASEAV